MESVLILLSTYNGEKYLEQQLKSLINQCDVDVNILIRDDGSNDGTINILKKWEKIEKDKVKWYSGKNLKAAKSFMDLVDKAKVYKYYAYCDQDDVWDKNKLKVAIKEISKKKTKEGILYVSTLDVVDKNLKFLRVKKIDRLYSLGESLIRNNVVGCTMVFDNYLLEKLKKYKPMYIDMHDSWTYKVCISTGGEVILDNNPYIKYRQHENNVIGAKKSVLTNINNRVKSIFSSQKIEKTRIAQELLDGYKDNIDNDNIILLTKFIDYKLSLKNKINIIRNKKINNGKIYQKILFAIDILFEKF
ncbi:glycosyltransferase [Clostridium perfringens]